MEDVSRSKALVISLIRANLRDPVAMLVLVILPTALSVALVYAMGNAPGVSGRAGIDFIGPETMAFNTAFVGTLGGAISIARWRENGTIRALRSVLVSKGAIMALVLGVFGGMMSCSRVRLPSSLLLLNACVEFFKLIHEVQHSFAVFRI